jgi:hypothetical protein
MNTMSMPGFTAEAALPGLGGTYKLRGDSEAPANATAVVPQACVNIGPCRACVTWRWFPPRACLTFNCLGFGFSRCVP